MGTKVMSFRIFLLFVVVMLFVGCRSTPELSTPEGDEPFVSPVSVLNTPAAAQPTPTPKVITPISPVTPEPAKSAVMGRAITATDEGPLPLTNTTIRLAEVIWENEQARDEGNFVLDGARSPGAITNGDGYFFIPNIAPKDYVIVVGQYPGVYAIVPEAEGSNRARIVEAEAGEIIDVGVLDVDLSAE